MKEFLDKIFEPFCVDREKYLSVRETVWLENWRSLRTFSAIATVTFFIMLLVCIRSETISQNIVVYPGYFMITLAIWLSTYLIRDNYPEIRATLVYFFVAVLLSYGIVMGTLVSPTQLTVSFIVLLILVPLLFNTRPLYMNLMILISMIIYVILARLHQEELVYHYNMTDVVPYCIVSMFTSSFLINVKMKRFFYEGEIVTLETSGQKKDNKIQDYEKFTTDMLRHASSQEEPDEVIQSILKYMCERMDGDRAYIFEDNLDGTFDNTYEWCRKGVTKEIDNLKKVPYKGLLDVWIHQFNKSHNVLIYDMEEYREVSEPLYEILKPQGIHSLVAGPIIVGGRIVGFYGLDNPPVDRMQDISDLIEMLEVFMAMMIRLRNNAAQLEENAIFDQLTHCHNRNALDWAYRGEFDPEKSCGILMCDLNGLKQVNDLQGHLAGDEFIRRTGETLKSVFGLEHVYRMGGDEFAVVLTDITEEEFREMVASAKLQTGTTASLGTAFRAKMDVTFDFLFRQADRDMYHVKKEYHASLPESED